MTKTTVSIIIPAYNEAQTIGDVVGKIRSLYPDSEIIVINDGSTDDTGKVAKEAGAIVYSHPYNIGNGAAIKSGIRIASGEILVFMDGDGQHDPEDIQKLIEHFSGYDMVVGARKAGHQSSWGRALGNRIYNWLASYVAKFTIQDLTSGFRAIKAEIAHNLLYLLPNTYSYPTTLTLGVLRSGRKLRYIPINIHKRKKGKSKIKLFKDGLRFFMIITKICALYSPLRIFLPVSFFMFILGSSYYLYTYCFWGRFTNMSALLFTTSILVFMMGLISEQICQMRFERSEGKRLF
ncbi:MAG: glycosyltransferase family 2 protein [Deltaproteobacteria bacterium]|nr:glycosyltransferase family 2 protein [Deltaproteobacteria bacterium]MBW2344501.1 glycosyltransferase family 2 protein [Deltaproteobacteria bacterium]